MASDEFGKYLAQIRCDNNLTQIQLADKLNTTVQTIINLEKGKQPPSSYILTKASSVLGVDFIEYYHTNFHTDRIYELQLYKSLQELSQDITQQTLSSMIEFIDNNINDSDLYNKMSESEYLLIYYYKSLYDFVALNNYNEAVNYCTTALTRVGLFQDGEVQFIDTKHCLSAYLVLLRLSLSYFRLNNSQKPLEILNYICSNLKNHVIYNETINEFERREYSKCYVRASYFLVYYKITQLNDYDQLDVINGLIDYNVQTNQTILLDVLIDLKLQIYIRNNDLHTSSLLFNSLVAICNNKEDFETIYDLKEYNRAYYDIFLQDNKYNPLMAQVIEYTSDIE